MAEGYRCMLRRDRGGRAERARRCAELVLEDLAMARGRRCRPRMEGMVVVLLLLLLLRLRV